MGRPRVNVLAVAQDPGGASALVPVLRALGKRPGTALRVLTRGPAGRVLRDAGIPKVVECSAPSHGGTWDTVAAAECAARQPSVLIAATSFAGGFETTFIRIARRSGVPSLAVLDGWSNYTVRFLSPGETGLAGKLPDAVCVMDAWAAAEMRQQGFPAGVLRVTGHPALDTFMRFRQSALAAKAAARLRRRLGLARETKLVAFMSQPISEMYGGAGQPASRGYNEFDALEVLQTALERNGRRVQLVIRPHPKESAEKFSPALPGAGVARHVMAEGNSDELVVAADVVVGMTSTMLVKALIANRPTLSLQPGLRGDDALVLSRMGLMRPVTQARALAGALERQLRRSNGSAPRLPSTWTDGRATERILAVVDELLARPRLAGSRVLLRPLEPDDAKGPYPGWFNDPEVCRGNSHGAVRYTTEDARRYIAHARTSRTDLIFAVVRTDEGRHIGNIALKRIDPVAQCGELAIIIGDKASWGQGFASEACRLLLDHAFFTLKLHRVSCGTFQNNTAMQRLAASLGMKAEGRRRQAAFKAGRFLDVVEYGVLQTEYARRRAGTRSR